MITVLLLHLGILHDPCNVHHELFHNPVDPVRVFAFHVLVPFGALPLQVHQAHGGHFRYWLVPFKLPQGDETSGSWLRGFTNCLVCGLQDSFMESSFSTSLAAQR